VWIFFIHKAHTWRKTIRPTIWTFFFLKLSQFFQTLLELKFFIVPSLWTRQKKFMIPKTFFFSIGFQTSSRKVSNFDIIKVLSGKVLPICYGIKYPLSFYVGFLVITFQFFALPLWKITTCSNSIFDSCTPWLPKGPPFALSCKISFSFFTCFKLALLAYCYNKQLNKTNKDFFFKSWNFLVWILTTNKTKTKSLCKTRNHFFSGNK
jgi:hypothetical protein